MTRRSKPVKPTAAERKLIDAALKKKYPQMYEPAPGETKMLKGLSTTDRKKLFRMVDRKLAKLRGSKKTRVLKPKYRKK